MVYMFNVCSSNLECDSGSMAMLVFFVYIAFIKSSPEEHALVSQKEFEYIKRTTMVADNKSSTAIKPSVPWRKLLTCKPLLAAIFARLTLNIPYYVVQTKMPAYMNDVLHVPIAMVNI